VCLKNLEAIMKVLIVDDHAVVRHGIRQIINDAIQGVEFGEASNAADAASKAWGEPWDVVILDISLPSRNGLDVLKDIKREKPDLPVLMLSMHPEDQFAVRTFKAGASGYLTKESAPEELVKAIHKVCSGGKYISEEMAEVLADSLKAGEFTNPHELLSDREYEVLCLIASGNTVSQIADKLSLSVKTISTYRARVLEKMKLRTNAELTHYAIRMGLVK
jgi:DNA-binding NarL/FixJ family response regulator